QLANVEKMLKHNNMSMEVDTDVKDWLGKLGFDIQFGARPLKRTIQKYITNPLSEKLLNGEFLPGDSIHARMKGEGQIEFEKVSK
ncbi:MAG TPA: type VI secretion system ATPase TssH, partial [Ignavibacteria bacterium]|nr:type VI secretion system ATPase TssH [Ignavibacteria bacterium]